MGPDEYVFPSDAGGRLSERSIQERISEIGARCGIDDLRAHRLRHTFCKRLADAGVAIQVIAKLAGHSSIEVTRRYVEPGEEDLASAVSLMRQGKMATKGTNHGK
jgi:integrase/recombinase XerC